MVARSRTRRRCRDRLDVRRQPRRPPSAADGTRSRRLRTRDDWRAAPPSLTVSPLREAQSSSTRRGRLLLSIATRKGYRSGSMRSTRHRPQPTALLPLSEADRARARVFRKQLKLSEATGRRGRAESKGRRDTRTERGNSFLAVDHESETDVADMDEVVLVEAQIGADAVDNSVRASPLRTTRAPAVHAASRASSSRRVLIAEIAAAGSTDVAYHVR